MSHPHPVSEQVAKAESNKGASLTLVAGHSRETARIVLPSVLWEQVQGFAQANHITVRALLVDALEDFLAREAGPRPLW
ncbi:MAG: hypothetical protein QMD09_12195 [Desulfatibacillaceae bacterium]|nr:hypothetical protein [Desulfatibacillaceae bacterium]